MATWWARARRHARVIWAKKKNGTTGPVGAQILSMSQLLGRKWNSEKAIATGTHNKPAPSGCWRRDPALAKHIPQDDCRSMIGNTTIVATNTIVQVLNSSMMASLTSQRRD